MLHLPNEATARDPIVRASARNVSESGTSSHRNMRRFWGGACFVIVLLAAFGQPLLGLANYAAHSSLHSYILLIPFASDYLVPLLSRSGRFFLSRTRLDESSGVPTRLSHFYGSDAGCHGRCAGERF